LGFPILDIGEKAPCAATDTGSPSLESERERENAPLAERCVPKIGLDRRIVQS
jgi:hypothetical protein